MNNLIKFHLKQVENFVGFAVETAEEGEMVKVRCRAAIISDQIDFFTYIEQISEQFLGNLPISINAVHQLLIIIHDNLTADIYINDFPTEVEILVNRTVKEGEFVYLKDVADIKNQVR